VVQEAPRRGASTGPVDLPRLISVDDHVIEPPHIWQENLPSRYREAGPTIVRCRGRSDYRHKSWVLAEDDSADWADVWRYDGKLFTIERNLAALSYPRFDRPAGAATFDEIRPGCYDPKARLADMDINHTDASLCFPTFPRFCGQTFLEATDHDLAAACVRAYNDWMIDDWCAGDAYGRLLPLTLIPLWDAELAAAEVRRCAAKGAHAMCFTESPPDLGLPSVYTDFWEPLWQACEETQTVVNMHIGSASKFLTTSPDAPPLVSIGLTHESAEHALVDWLCSGILERYPTIKMVLSEGQAGWIPFVLERLDRSNAYWGEGAGVADRISRPPSSYVPGRVYACAFEDNAGLAMRDRIGMSQLMFETDYPHTDSTWPDSAEIAGRMVAGAGLDQEETRMFLRANAVECYGLERYGIRP
jgi:predicted TIM-barrel fold metal-dependent hydrolase